MFCKTKFSGTSGGREIFIFPVQLTTSRTWQHPCTVPIFDDDHIPCILYIIIRDDYFHMISNQVYYL